MGEEESLRREVVHWLSIPGEPSLEKSSARSSKVINRSCTSRHLPLPPCTSSVRSVNATSRHQSHTVRRGGEVVGSRDECEGKEGRGGRGGEIQAGARREERKKEKCERSVRFEEQTKAWSLGGAHDLKIWNNI